MPAWATNMVALPFVSSFHNELFAHRMGSASILLALAGMLPASHHSASEEVPSVLRCLADILSPTVPRIVRAFAPGREGRERQRGRRCPRSAVRGRDRPDGSPRSTRFRLRES
jgi:hypothetical protein